MHPAPQQRLQHQHLYALMSRKKSERQAKHNGQCKGEKREKGKMGRTKILNPWTSFPEMAVVGQQVTTFSISRLWRMKDLLFRTSAH
jgi:hypothetical protein